MVIALWNEVEMPNESLEDFVKNRIRGYHHNQVPEEKAESKPYPFLSVRAMEAVENLDKADAHQLLHRIECALRYQEAFPNRAPTYALRAEELIPIESYPPVYPMDTELSHHFG